MKDGCGLCKRYGHACQYHPDDDGGELRPVTGADLSSQQIRAVETLVSRGTDEDMGSVAERAGVTRMTLWRWLQDPEFVQEYRKRVEDELGTYRAKVATALVKGCVTPGKGQSAMQRIYWQRLGQLVERKEHSGPGGGPIQQHSPRQASETLRDRVWPPHNEGFAGLTVAVN